MNWDLDHSSTRDHAGPDSIHGFDIDDTTVVSTAMSCSFIENVRWNQSGGSFIYSQTLTPQDTITVSFSTKDELDISGISDDVDGSDKGVGDLETGADNVSDGEFDVLLPMASLTHPAKENPESAEAPNGMKDHDKFSAEALLFAENYMRNAPFPQRLNLALPTIRFPTKSGIVDNLPDWDLSAKSVYYLQWYMALDVEKIEVTLVPVSAKIVYEPRLRQFQYLGESNEWFQSIAYVNVTRHGVTDTAILLAYTTAKFEHVATSVANRGQSSAGASQNVR